MTIERIANYVVGVWMFIQARQERAERGLSSSAENAILVAGAVAVAFAVVAAVTTFVKYHLPK